jgi:hypothetical protein
LSESKCGRSKSNSLELDAIQIVLRDESHDGLGKCSAVCISGYGS